MKHIPTKTQEPYIICGQFFVWISLHVKYWFIQINPFIHMLKYLPKNIRNVYSMDSKREYTVDVRAAYTADEREIEHNQNRKMLLDNLPQKMFQ